MRLLQKPKEETPSLSLWLSRDVPQERELAGEFLDRLGREKSMEILLHLHDLEETRRQKRLRPYFAATAICFAALIATLLAVDIQFFRYIFVEHRRHLHFVFPFELMVGFVLVAVRLLERWGSGGRRGKRPWFSTSVQQNLITSLFEYADDPLTTEAFVRALTYYRGDRDRLARVIAELFPRLPDDPDALTVQARRILAGYSLRLPRTAAIFPGEAKRAATLQHAITTYLARTGQPISRLARVLLGPFLPSLLQTKETD